MSVVYVDTDVIISSLLSQKGAAFLLLENKLADFVISDLSEKEILEVGKRFKISQAKVKRTIKRLRKVKSAVGKTFEKYVLDPEDVHIIAGASSAKARFLLTYNSRHFLTDKIKSDLGIIVMTPALFLQYLRSKRGI